MKKSARITLTVLAVAGMAACSRQRVDPCEASYFDEQACQDAVRNRGYYWHGTWFPMTYSYPYPYYYDSYRTHVSHGGTVRAAPAGSYGHSGSSAPSVQRGGFGSTGASHAAGE